MLERRFIASAGTGPLFPDSRDGRHNPSHLSQAPPAPRQRRVRPGDSRLIRTTRATLRIDGEHSMTANSAHQTAPGRARDPPARSWTRPGGPVARTSGPRIEDRIRVHVLVCPLALLNHRVNAGRRAGDVAKPGTWRSGHDPSFGQDAMSGGRSSRSRSGRIRSESLVWSGVSPSSRRQDGQGSRNRQHGSFVDIRSKAGATGGEWTSGNGLECTSAT